MRKHVDCIATLAQLVERLTRNEKVAGPIPASGSDYLFTHSYSELLCASGGIGRRAGFRFLFHWSEGSSPFSRTLSCVKTSFRCFGTFCFVFCVGMCQDIVPFLSVMVVAGRSF